MLGSSGEKRTNKGLVKHHQFNLTNSAHGVSCLLIFIVYCRSGLLEQGVDRIVAQVVDPKVQHTFRPQVERVVRQFLSPGNHMDEEEPPHALVHVVENQEAQLLSPGKAIHLFQVEMLSSSFFLSLLSPPCLFIFFTISLTPSTISSAPVSDSTPSQSYNPSVIKTQDRGEEDMSLVEEDEKEAEWTKEEKEQEEKLGGNEDEPSKEREKEEEQQKEAMEVDQSTEEHEQIKKEEEEEQEEEKERKGEEEKESKCEDAKDKKGSGKNREESSSDKLHIRQKARERLKEGNCMIRAKEHQTSLSCYSLFTSIQVSCFLFQLLVCRM